MLFKVKKTWLANLEAYSLSIVFIIAEKAKNCFVLDPIISSTGVHLKHLITPFSITNDLFCIIVQYEELFCNSSIDTDYFSVTRKKTKKFNIHKPDETAQCRSPSHHRRYLYFFGNLDRFFSKSDCLYLIC